MNASEIETLKRALLQARFDAEYNECYYGLICQRYQFWDKAARVALAAAAVVAVAGMRIGRADLWQAVSGAVAMLSTMVLPALKWHLLIPRLETERRLWIELSQDYTNLWQDASVSADWEAAAREMRRLRKRDNALEASGGVIPAHGGLLRQARQRVVARNGGEMKNEGTVQVA